ncbi:MAG: alpha-1,2-fucosyltransferase [Ferruginibacter sp.]|nr:alpha-1,2-fucosyltransferase [Ferruginibacter sp.]
MSLVWCKIPKAGLGNQLFPLLHAAVFAHINDLPLHVTGYHQIKIGPYLRSEKVKRHYAGYFIFQKNVLAERLLHIWLSVQCRFSKVIPEPELRKLSNHPKNEVYIFEALPSSNYYFEQLKPHRTLVKKLFLDMIQPAMLQLIMKLTPPIVGVHIRMGDFRKLLPGEEYNGGHVRTPETYYTDIISGIRNVNQKLPVSVFTDGYKDEFKQLFQMPEVNMVEGNPDIVDLFLLSKSKIFVGTYGSTFSYWAAFLSDDIVIMHRFLKFASIRPEEMKEEMYEGPFDIYNKRLIESISKINTDVENQ